MDPVIKSHDCINENTGDGEGVQHLVQQLESQVKRYTASSDGQTRLLLTAAKAIETSRLTVEKLLDSTHFEDRYTIEVLAGILSALKGLEREICLVIR